MVAAVGLGYSHLSTYPKWYLDLSASTSTSASASTSTSASASTSASTPGVCEKDYLQQIIEW